MQKGDRIPLPESVPEVVKDGRAEKVTEIIEEVIEEICDDYCKYPEEYWEDPDKMIEDRCSNCPLNRL